MSDGFQRGIELFNRGEFFQSHEVLEDVWTLERGPRRLFLQSIIHVAVGLHHHHNGNPAGAEKQLRKALKKLANYRPACEGIDTARLFRDTQACLDCVLRGEPAEDPIIVHVGRSPGTAPDPWSGPSE